MNKNLFESKTVTEVKERINSLTENKTPDWGKMNVSQMLAHCSEVLKNGLGEIQQKRKLIGYIVAPFIRHRYYDSEPYKNKGNPSTHVIIEEKDFGLEKVHLLRRIDEFHNVNRDRLKNSVHPILGKFTPDQWAIGQYKHLDHHLRQFGV